ncbi:P-loop NTPase family protein [Devosia sp. A449]
MVRVLLVGQEKGGVGKSLVVRGLAEAVPAAPVIEVDSNQRLLELGKRVTYFPMRADRTEIEKTGGRAARSEFDGVINAIAGATTPTIVDVGANTSRALLSVLADVKDALEGVGVELGMLVVATSEPGALSEAQRLMDLARPIATRFVLNNQVAGMIDDKMLAKIAGGVPVSTLEGKTMDDEAVALLQAGGLASVPQIDTGKLNEKYGIARGVRIQKDLSAMRLAVMEAVRGPAKWLVGE